MLECIPDILTFEELRDIRKVMSAANFMDGAKTAGFRAKRVKKNEQLGRDANQRDEINKTVIAGLRRSKDFNRFVQPAIIQTPLFSRYRAGMEYGLHVDDARMGTHGKFRTDVSVTVFLNQPNEYEGGELEMETGFGTHPIKLPAGAAVVYPSSTLHRVLPVAGGERLAAVTWVQSHVRRPDHRELLTDVDKIRRKLSELDPDGAEADLAFKTYANLLREWSD